MYAIRVDGLRKKYDQFELGEISFSIPEGSIVGFIGENGAGKTTTMKAILGLIHMDGGSVQIFGKERDDRDCTWKEHVGVALDTCRFPDNMTAQQVGKMMMQMYKTWDQDKYMHYLKRFSIPFDKRVKEYSRGMGMKLTLAVALSHDTRLLILDEATSGLDPVIRNEILDLFLDFVQEENHTIFLSSHITSDVEKVADYILVIHEGKLLLYENKDTLLYDYGIIKCPKGYKEQLSHIDSIGMKENPHNLEILVRNRNVSIPEGAVMDHVSLEDILLFLTREGSGKR